MSSKYMIHTQTVPSRFKALTNSGIIVWEEGCLKCPECVKKQCVYGVYDKRNLDARQMIDSLDNQCMNCLRCVQGCPKELIHKSLNPEYYVMGDAHWTPDIIFRLWDQAETGKIPVSGSGYPGPFSGPGFDSMWTDMSEIVRPTRDGIHGREYISTAVDLGGTPSHIEFGGHGDLLGDPPALITIPLPVILRVPPLGSLGKNTIKGWALAAKELGTFLALPHEMIDEEMVAFKKCLIPSISPAQPYTDDRLGGVRLIEILWGENWKEITRQIREAHPSAPTVIRLPLVGGTKETVLSLVNSGVSVISLEGTSNGRLLDDNSVFIRDPIRSIHLALVEYGIRDKVTILVGGGLAMAEHVAKAIICGADGVVIDLPILIALECRMCRRCTRELPCPVEIDQATSSWVASRTINLLGAWHNQILEIMGAMGIRDVRRLRGETGRAMFFEDLDRNTFGSLGEVQEGYALE
jgi:ferredoxin